MTTPAEALVSTRDLLKEPVEAAYLNTELRGYMNLVLKDMARRTFYLRDTDTINGLASTSEYTAANDVIRIDEVKWVATGDTRQHSLSPRAYGVLQQYQSDDVSDPVIYTTWGVQPAVKFQVYPSPYTSGIFTLSIRRFPALIPTDGSGDANQIELPNGWDDCMFEGVWAKAYRSERRYDLADQHLRDYESKLSDMIMLVSQTDDAPNEIRWDHASMVPWFLEY